MHKKVLIILGHPEKNSFCAALANAYADGLKQSNHEIRNIFLSDLNFNPLLNKALQTSQKLEPDLVQAQADIKWADHIAFFYPNWWGSMPALLKGFFDRALTPGFGFKFKENSVLWDKLLSGKTAHLFVTMATPSWYYRWFYNQPGHNQMKKTILGVCGIKVKKISEFSSIKKSTDKKRNKWLNQTKNIGQKLT